MAFLLVIIPNSHHIKHENCKRLSQKNSNMFLYDERIKMQFKKSKLNQET